MYYNPFQRNPNQFIQQVNSMKNPQTMVQQMPQYKNIMEYVNANGGDAKQAFYAKAKEMGVNPEEFLKMLR